MKVLLLATSLVFLVCFGDASRGDNSPVENVQAEYHLEDPFKFVMNEFKNHDIIFLGEAHKIKENLLFLQELMQKMHNRGINILFYEFANYADSTRINQLINAEFYDEKLAMDLLLSAYEDWNYGEYADIFRAAWNININCRKFEKRFKIIGLNGSKAVNGINQIWTDENWAQCIYDDAIKKRNKALVYCGAQHALTKYRVPVAENGKFSHLRRGNGAGQYVYGRIGKKCMTIWFHQIWPDKFNEYLLSPCQGYLDTFISSLPGDQQQFAFDTGVSPLGQLQDSASLYSLGYNPVRLRQITDGYIVLKPLSKLTRITSF